MNHLTHWIKRHPVAAFYILTFAITCGLGFSYGAVYQRNQYLLLPFAFTATCGPALAGIIITAITLLLLGSSFKAVLFTARIGAWIGTLGREED
jgi:hypothetical protein